VATFSAKSDADLIGTDGNDIFWGSASFNFTAYGGPGDDKYYLYSSKNHVSENPGEGTDSIVTWMNFTLPDNFENLSVSASDTTPRFAFGNSLDNTINGGNGIQYIDGLAGNDTLRGGAGPDVFIEQKGNGSDKIMDFSAEDTVRIGSYGFKSFAQVVGHMKQVGSDVQLWNFNGETITFANKQIADFTPANFELQIDKSHFTMTFEDQFRTLSMWNGIKGDGAQGTWDSNFFWGQPNGHTESGFLNWDINTRYAPTASLNPFSIADGHLTITASATPPDMLSLVGGKAYTSGLLNTHYSFSQEYGYFEARIDVPDNTGAWPAFWLLPQDDSWPPEIDIMEMQGSNPNTLIETAHSKATGTHTQDRGLPAVESTAGYHTYGLLWTATQLVWYFDGTEVHRTATPDDMHKPMYMVLDNALGMSSTVDLSHGDQMHVDYVRAYHVPDDLVV